jgi:hypothetical protein
MPPPLPANPRPYPQVPATLFELRLKVVTEQAQAIEKSDRFNNLITCTILLVGVFIGIDTDALMACERHTIHDRPGTSPNCETTVKPRSRPRPLRETLATRSPCPEEKASNDSLQTTESLPLSQTQFRASSFLVC